MEITMTIPSDITFEWGLCDMCSSKQSNRDDMRIMFGCTTSGEIMEEERLVAQRIRKIMTKNIGKDND